MSYQGPAGPPYQGWRPEPQGSGPYQNQPYQWPDEQTQQMPPPANGPQRPAWGQPEPPSPGYGQPPQYGQSPPYPPQAYQEPSGYEPAPHQPYPPQHGGSYPDPRSGREPYPDQYAAQASGPPAPASGPPAPTSPAGPYRGEAPRQGDLPGPAASKGRKKPPKSGPKAAKKALKALAGGKMTVIIAGMVVVVLALAGGGIWYLTRDTGSPHHRSAAAPAPEGSPAVDVKATGGMQVAPSSAAEDLFPTVVTPLNRPEHTREAVGETSCASVAAGRTAKTVLKKIGCKKVYLALYVDKSRKYAVTMGYINVGSKARAKKAAAKDYGTYPKFNTWFRFLIPEGSKITEKTRIFTYVSSDRTYVTFGVTGYFNGKNASKGLDEALTKEAIAVGVAVMFA